MIDGTPARSRVDLPSPSALGRRFGNGHWRSVIPLHVTALSLGPLGTNCFIVSRSGTGEDALVIDPGEDPDRIEASLAADELRCVSILVTHAHFDHIGAVGPLARTTGSPVYLSSGEANLLVSPNDGLPPGIGPFEPYEADVKLRGDEVFVVAGLTVTTHLAPGHSPAGLVFEIADAEDGATALFVG